MLMLWRDLDFFRGKAVGLVMHYLVNMTASMPKKKRFKANPMKIPIKYRIKMVHKVFYRAASVA